MFDKTFQLTVLTPEKEIFCGKAFFLNAKAIDGRISILANHAPLMIPLAKGLIKFKSEEGRDWEFEASRGFLKVLDHEATVLIS